MNRAHFVVLLRAVSRVFPELVANPRIGRPFSPTIPADTNQVVVTNLRIQAGRTTMPSQAAIRQQITSTIVEHLKAGKVAPWRSPWVGHPNAGPPTNIMSCKKYRGINVLLLHLHQLRFGWKSKFYATFNQWKSIAGRIKPRPSDVPPGQWGCQITFFKPVTKLEQNDRGEEVDVQYPLLRTYTIFSVDQVEGAHLDRFRVGELSVNPDFIDFDPAEEAITATGADIRLNGEAAYYRRDGDFICCPEKKRFPQEKEFYAALLHELGHWSECRLDWKGSYAEGELRAEMAACFALAELGVPQSDDLTNSTAYLSSWLTAMQNDPRFIFRASTDASKAVNYLLSFSREPVEEPEEVMV
jgi:antirestriction protein ArdC